MSPDNQPGQGPDNGDRDLQYWLRSMERGGYAEMARKTTPQEVRHDTRQFLSIQERNAWRLDQQPNRYLVDNMVTQLSTRSRQVTISLPMGYGEWSAGDINAGLDRDPAKAEVLASEYDRSAEEIEARRTLLEKREEQKLFSGDLKLYVEDAFQNLRKTRMDSANYGRIFNLESTEAEFDGFGEKVERAMDKWREVAEGRAVVEITHADGRTELVTLPNPFAMPRISGYYEWIMDNYIAVGLDSHQAVHRDGVADQVMERALGNDNVDAALTALLLVDHWDLDVEWSNSRAGYKQAMTPDDVKDVVMELGTKDVEKMAYPENRRIKEYRGGIGKGEGRREYVRPVGPPATLGCYPRMTASAIDVLTVEVPVLDKNGVAQERTESVSIRDLVWGEGKGHRIDANGKTEEIRFRPMKFSEIPWDNVGIFGVDGAFIGIDSIDAKPAARGPLTEAEAAVSPDRRSVKVWELVEGVPTDAFEVPYKLQSYLAHKAVFAQATRTDYDRLYAEIVSGSLLPGLNKNMENSMGMLASGKGVDEKTAAKLQEYMRVVFLGGVGASMVKMSFGTGGVKHGVTHDKQPQVMTGQTLDRKPLRMALVEAAEQARFLKVKEDSSGVKIDERSQKLLDYIIDNRRAPTPYELEKAGLKGWFTKDELEALRPLYPTPIN